MATRRRGQLSTEARRVLREADKLERLHGRDIEDAFMEMIADYGSLFDDAAIARFMTTGRVPSMLEAFAIFIEHSLRPVWTESAIVGVALQDPFIASRGVLAANTVNQTFDKWASDRGSQLVTNFTTQQRRSVDAVVQFMGSNGRSNQEIAEAVRGVVGLTRRQTDALIKLEETMEARGATRREIVIATDRRRRQMEQQRAETIVRTEVGAAINEGIIAAAKGEDVGANDGLTSRLFIRAFPDCCEQCAEIERSQPPNGIGVDDDWPTYGRPPFHPRCRCVVVVERVRI